MVTKTHFILYVKDQKKSMEFYSKLLCTEPTLNVPGMTEFTLSKNIILGLMPANEIEKLLEQKVNVAEQANNKIKAELYLVVDNLDKYCRKAAELNAVQLSEIKARDWGDKAAYFLDPDNYIIALAEKI